MTVAQLLLVLVMQASESEADAGQHPADLEPLRHQAKQVRESAVAALAASPAATKDLLPHLDHGDSRVARGVIAALRRRLAEDALPALARCAEHADAARAEAAARAAVAIALHHRADLEALDFEGMARLPGRLQAAVDDDIEAHLPKIRGFGHTRKTQNYRRFFAAGRYAASTLTRIGRDRSRAEHVREHALHALALLLGYKAEDTLLQLLDDGAPRVRIAACSLTYQYATSAAHRTLARRLDSVRLHQEYELAWIVAAVERTGIVSEAGAKKLEKLATGDNTFRALGAMAALRKTRPQLFLRLVRERVTKFLDREEQHPRAASEVALFEFRVGPLPADLRQRMRQSKNPLVRAAATDDRDEALRVLAPVVAPEHAVGSHEAMRVRIVHRLLIKHEAPEKDRVRFAKLALNSQLMASRRAGVRVLLGVGPAARAPLRKRLQALLEDRFEPVRLGAARLLAPDAAAVEVAILALYDGDYGSARIARRLLQEARPDWPAINPDGSAADRRRQARTLWRLHKSAPRGKE